MPTQDREKRGATRDEPFCDTKEFKSDISELCANCELAQYIMEGVKNQIVFQAIQQRDILPEAIFLEYIDTEIKNAQKTMMEMNLNMRRHETDSRYIANIPNTTMVFIWNKERIKALNGIQSSSDQRDITALSVLSPLPVNDSKSNLLGRAQISLVRIYEGQPITQNNASQVAAKYGREAPNAGKSLLKKYDELDIEEHRLQHRDIVNHIESIKPFLSSGALLKAERELNKIRNKPR